MHFRFRPFGRAGSALEIMAGAAVLSSTNEGYLLVAGGLLIGAGAGGIVAAAQRESVHSGQTPDDINQL